MLRETDVFEAQGFAFADSGERKPPALVAVEHGAQGAAATIADAHLLFNSDFARAGNDLHLNGHNGERAIVRDYFNGEPAALLSREGARLSPDLVEALTRSVAPHQVAQATPPAPAASDAVGRVVTASPDSTILRNGVPVTVAPGDPVLRADVLQTATGTMAVTFNDGSTLNLTANTRIVVSEFIYSPSNTGNSQLLDLVQGSLTFISGEVAHTGDMRIGTPVATMGIRGTVGGVTTASDGTVQFYVSQSATGAVIINQQGQIIANVVQDGPLIVVRPVGPLQVIADEIQKSPAQLAVELQALQQIVNIKAVGDQLLQQFFQQQQQNPNPQSPQNGPHTQIPVDDKLKITLLLDDTNGGNGGATPVTHAVIERVSNDPDDSPIHINVPIPVNLPPVTFAPLALTTAEDTPLVFGGQRAISVIDSDSANLTVTLSVTNGVLALGSLAGLTFVSGGGTGHASMTFSGSPAAIAAALNGLTYTPAQDYNGPATLTLTAGDGNSTPLNTSVTLNVTAVNDAPVIGGAPSTPVAYTENDGATVVNAALTISDVDSATLTGATVKIVANFVSSEDELSFTAQGGITGTYDAQTGILTLSGPASLADYQAVLRSVTYENTSGNPSNAARTIEFQVNDGSAQHAASNVVSAVVNVSPANDAPVLALGGRVADQFDSQAYNLNSGTANWVSGWIENENGEYQNDPPATTGEIRTGIDPAVSDTGFRLFLSDDDNEAGAADTIQRTADLTGATSATLTFDYRRQISDGDSDDVVKVWISTDGVNFTQIGQIGSAGGDIVDQTYQQFSVDISGYISPTTTIRFSIDDGVDNGDEFYIDNVKIDYLADSTSSTYVEGGSAVSIAPAGTSIKDIDNTTLQSATITLTNAQAGDLLSVCGQLPAGICASSYDAQTGMLTLTGEASLADYQAALAQIQFSTSGDNPSGADRIITVVVSDGTANSNTGTVTVHVTPVNDAPVNTIVAALSVDEDTNLSINGLQVADADAGAASITTTLSVAHGTLSFASSQGGATITGNGTDVVILTGTVAQINATLAATDNLTYRADADFNGADTLTMSTNDGGNSGTGGAQSDVDTVAITVDAVNDTPAATITPTSYNATEQTALTLKGSGLAISDVDAASGSMTVTLSVTEGILNATAGDSGASVSNTGTSSLTITGTVAQINALLAAGGTSTLSYINNSDTPSASATLSLQVADNGNTGGGSLTASDTATINIAAVNDAPTLSTISVLGGATEDTARTITYADLAAAANEADVDSGTLSFRVQAVSSGTLTKDGNAVTAGVTTLVSGESLVWTPAANASGTLNAFTVVVWDGSAASSSPVQVRVDVAPDADAPTLTNNMTPVAATGEFRLNATTANGQYYAAVASLSNGGFVTTWTSDSQDGSFAGVYAQRYDNTGTKVGGEFLVNTTTANSQAGSSVAGLGDGSFVILWASSGQDAGATWGIYGQRYAANGTPSGGEFRVNSTTAGDQTLSGVTALSGGGFVATWTDSAHDGAGSGVYGQVYDASGSPVGSEFQVNTTTSGNQTNSAAAALPGGGFVVAWQSSGQDGDGNGIYFQRFDASGAKVGSETLANTTTAGNQTKPDVAVLSDGTFVVKWEASGGVVYVQHFDASGTKIDSEFQANTSSAGTGGSDIVALPDGGYIVTWSGADAGSWGGFAQRYSADGVAIGAAFTLNQTLGGNQYFHQSGVGKSVAVLDSGQLVGVWGGAPDISSNEVYGRIFTLPSVGAEDAVVTLPKITSARIDADGSETLALKLSGFPVGATFSKGAAGTGADAGLWVISSAADITSLSSTPLTMTPPANYNGSFVLHIDAVTVDTATLSTGAATDTATTSQDVTITVTAANDAPSVSSISVSGSTISFNIADADNAAFTLASASLAAAFGNPALALGSNSITPTWQGSAVSGTLQLSDGSGGVVDILKVVLGSGGNDAVLSGASDASLMDGGPGTDNLLLPGGFADTSDSQIVNIETIAMQSAGTFNLSHQTEGFTITGSGGVDSITAGSGNDTIVGDQNDTLLDGGGGTDTLQVGANFTSTGNGQIVNIEAVTLTAALTLDLSNQTEALAITGSSGADTITGGSANDIITGGAGADTLNGGGGNDQFIVTSPGDLAGDIINGGTGDPDQLRLSAAGTYDLSTATLSNIDRVTFNQNAAGFVVIVNDAATATADNNNDGVFGDFRFNAVIALTNGVTIDAHALTAGHSINVAGVPGNGSNMNGADTITGGAGDDVINGGGGADILTGGLGTDAFYVSSVGDLTGKTIEGTLEQGTIDEINLQSAGAYNFSDATAISHVDRIVINNTSTGNSVILTDAMVATADFNMDGTLGDMRVAATTTTAAVTINAAALSSGSRISTNGDQLGGNDTIIGGAGADTIEGGGGGDRITGGGGNDTLTGDLSTNTTGVDTFVFNAGFGHDTVTDFKADTDFLEFQGTFANVAALLAATADVNGDAVITLDGNNSVTLNDVTKQMLIDNPSHIHIV